MSNAEQKLDRTSYNRWIETEWDGQEMLALAFCLDALVEATGGDYGEMAALTESERVLLSTCFTGLHPAKDALHKTARDFYERIGPGRLRSFAAELGQLDKGDPFPFEPTRQPGAKDLTRPSIGSKLKEALDRHECTLTFQSDEGIGDTVFLMCSGAIQIGHVVDNGGLWEAYALVRPHAVFGNEKFGAHQDFEDAIRAVLANFMY